MVTGDHEGTAEAVARELGLIDGAGAVMTGSEFAGISDEAWRARADGIAVYARTTPADKVRITGLFQKTISTTINMFNEPSYCFLLILKEHEG